MDKYITAPLDIEKDWPLPQYEYDKAITWIHPYSMMTRARQSPISSLESTHIIAIVGRGWLRKPLDAGVDEYLLGEAFLI